MEILKIPCLFAKKNAKRQDKATMQCKQRQKKHKMKECKKCKLFKTPNMQNAEQAKKLRDVQQEREGTSLNYFNVLFGTILDYLGLPVTFSD